MTKTLYTPENWEMIKKMGSVIATSQLLGCQSDEQGMVIAMVCLARNTDPIAIDAVYDIVSGNLSMKSEAMLNRYVERGGQRRQIQRDSQAAVIELTNRDGECQQFSFTLAEAEAEPYTKAKGGGWKDNWSTPRRRMQMMWARVVSDAVRAMDPGVTAGVYTPEETVDFAGQDQLQADNPVVSSQDPPAAVCQEPATQTEAAPTPEPQPAGKASEAAPGPDQAPWETEEASQAAPEPIGSTNGYAQAINQLFIMLQVPKEDQAAALGRRGAATLQDLAPEAARGLLEALAGKVKDYNRESIHGPCHPTQQSQVKMLLTQVVQTPGNQHVADRLREKLKSSGLSLAQLSYAECEGLLTALHKKNLDAFFEASLTGGSLGE